MKLQGRGFLDLQYQCTIISQHTHKVSKKFNDLLRRKALKPLIRSKDIQSRSKPNPQSATQESRSE
jgi:hypothetical protein